jgi:hypothetical protein
MSLGQTEGINMEKYSDFGDHGRLLMPPLVAFQFLKVQQSLGA